MSDILLSRLGRHGAGLELVKSGRSLPLPDAAAMLSALPMPAVVLDAENRFRFANPAAELFFQLSFPTLATMRLGDLLSEDSRLFALLAQVRQHEAPVSDHDMLLDSPRLHRRGVAAHGGPLPEMPGGVVLTLHDGSTAQMMNRQLNFLGAARGASAMAEMLAHEVKNPLSGIRGAAQLLEQNASTADRELTRLICDEADRICALVDRMDVFSDRRPLERAPINIHEVLERVRRAAQSGFARNIRFIEDYDPSLPAIDGNRDLLIQAFLNLVKNAAEAAPAEGGEIVLSTQYQHGIRLAVAGSDSRVHLPLVVSVTDNGEGIPEDLRNHLFDPFVSTKHNGTGLGLALVAKVVGDHGGVIEFESTPRGTVFRVYLPMVPRVVVKS